MSMKSLYIAFFLGVLVVHSCMFELAICSTNYTDQLSFLAFKSSIDHDPNNVSTNWTKEINFCNWAGILCSRRRQRVTSLHLWPSLSRVSLPPFLHHHSHHTPHTHDMHSLSLSSPSRLLKPITHNHTAAHTHNTTTFIFMHHLHQPITTIHNTHHHRGHPCTPTRQTNPALSLLSLSHSHAQPTSHTLSAHSSHRRYNTHTWRWMGDPYWRYGAPAERGSIPRPSFPGYLLPEPSSLTSHHLWSSNDLQGIAADFVQKDPGAYGVNDITGVGPGLSDLISKRPGSLARVDGLPVPAKDSNILFVDGLPSDCLRREVGHLFRPFIGFKDIRVVHKEPRHSGDKAMVLCFVEFNDAKCALTAMEALQVALLESRRGQDSAHIGCMKSGVVITEDDFGEVYMEDAFTWV